MKNFFVFFILLVFSTSASALKQRSYHDIFGGGGGYTHKLPPALWSVFTDYPSTGFSGDLPSIQAVKTAYVDAAAIEPIIGTAYYYCDCGTGADAGCVAGNNANAGTDPAAPRQTIASAMTRLAAFTSSAASIMLCKGGAFNDASNGMSITNSTCTSGTYCHDIRSYTPPTWSSSGNKPRINSTSASPLFTISGSAAGIRLIGLNLVAGGIGTEGVFLYTGVHDIWMWDLDIDGFNFNVHSTGTGTTYPNRIYLQGSLLQNAAISSAAMGSAFLGGGDEVYIRGNEFKDNGSNQLFNHALYLSGVMGRSQYMYVSDNWVHGQVGATCNDGPFISHGAFSGGLTISRNWVEIAASAYTSSCWGMSLTNISSTNHPVEFRNLVVDSNTIINGGNRGMSITSAVSPVIQNNRLIYTATAGGINGITIVYNAAVDRTTYGCVGLPAECTDTIGNAYTIRNNLVYFGANTSGTNTGITTNVEGTGHIISNNTVSTAQASGTLNCYQHDLALSAYAFMDNNHCYSAGTYNFARVGTTGYTLANWQPHSGFDGSSVTGAPNFANVLLHDYTPTAGSALIGTGNNTNRSPNTFKGTSWGTSYDIGPDKH